MQYLGTVLEMTEWSWFTSKANHSTSYSNPSLCPNYCYWRSWSCPLLWRLPRHSRTNTKKRCPFHHRGLECKSMISRDTWSNRQAWPWNIKWSRGKANRVLPREHTGHGKQPLPITQRQFHTWTSDSQYWNQIGCILCSQRWRLYTNSIQSAKQDLELNVAQIMSSLFQNPGLNWRK